jgi:glycine/D-amino acid oxidase-like deaminating enzyme
MDRLDVLVIGNGALGLAIAHRLNARDKTLKLGVLGPKRRVGAATLAAGAMLNAWAEVGRGQFDHAALADRVRLPLGALPLWNGLCAELSEYLPGEIAPIWGTLILDSGLGGANERESIDAMAAAIAELEGPPSVLPADGKRAKAVVIPDGWIPPHLVLAGFEAALDAGGAQRIDGKAERVAQAGSAWRVVLESGAEVEAGIVVLAAGPFVQDLVDQIPALCESTPRLLFEPGYGLDLVASVEPPGPVIRTMARGSVGGFHLIAMGEGRFYLGSTSQVGLVADPSDAPEKAEALKRMLGAEVDPAFAEAHYTPRALGFRALGADGFPLLGQTPLKGLYIAAGFRRDGFTSCPLVGVQIAEAILGGGAGPPTRFAPSRTLIAYKTPDEAFEDAVATHGEARRAELAATRKKRGLDTFGLHPALWPLYGDDDAFALLDHARES